LERLRAGALLVDVRDADEFAEARVAGALYVGLPDIEAQIAKLPRDRDVLLFSRSGRRSGLAQDVLVDCLGYSRVGLPLEKAELRPATYFKQF